MANRRFRVALVGATGAVGRELLKTLAQREFPVETLTLFASKKSAGKGIQWGVEDLEVEELKEPSQLAKFDFVFFTAGSAVSERFAPEAARAGAWVIDNASVFRLREDVPLVVPEVNSATLRSAVGTRLVANPNCTTAQLVMALKPLHDTFQIERVVVSSYQAVSGKGQLGIDEFQQQVKAQVERRAIKAEAFPHPIAFNCIPQIDSFREDGFTGEEHKVISETKKILGEPSLRVTATCVRVPVLNGHSESVAIETRKPFKVEEARKALEAMPGVRVVDLPSKSEYPLAMAASGKDEVLVGRLRLDGSLEPGRHGALFWVVADNLRKGAALNAVQIAESIIGQKLI